MDLCEFKASQGYIEKFWLKKNENKKPIREKQMNNEKRLETLEQKITDIGLYIKNLYMDKVKGVVSENDYIALVADFTKDRDKLIKEKEELNRKKQEIAKKAKERYQSFVKTNETLDRTRQEMEESLQKTRTDISDIMSQIEAYESMLDVKVPDASANNGRRGKAA